jgi:hypothetical protein
MLILLETCGKIGKTSVAPTASFSGQFSTLTQCVSQGNMAGYVATSFHHPSNTCYYYNEPVSSLNVATSVLWDDSNNVFFDTACNGGTYVPSCNYNIAASLDGNIIGATTYEIPVNTPNQTVCALNCEQSGGLFLLCHESGSQYQSMHVVRNQCCLL